jgi:hypothetical protein
MPEDPDERDQNEDSENLALSENAAEVDAPADTPFDHPLFLPAILAGLWVWFGYDGFLNQDPEMLEHLSFNRGGFAILSAATAWFGYKGWKEMSERNPQDPT